MRTSRPGGVDLQGIHLIRHSIFRTQELGGQYLLLGTGHLDPDFRSALQPLYLKEGLACKMRLSPGSRWHSVCADCCKRPGDMLTYAGIVQIRLCMSFSYAPACH